MGVLIAQKQPFLPCFLSVKGLLEPKLWHPSWYPLGHPYPILGVFRANSDVQFPVKIPSSNAA
jgi:hypothetical protein